MTQYKDLVLDLCNINTDDEKRDGDMDDNDHDGLISTNSRLGYTETADHEVEMAPTDLDIHHKHPNLTLLNVSPHSINRQTTNSTPDLTRMDYNFDECNFKGNRAIPHSSIVHRQDYIENNVGTDNMDIQNNKRRLLTIIHKLFHRYINDENHETMEMEINIHYYTRNIYKGHIGRKSEEEFIEANRNISKRKLFEYFDNVLIEIWRLLQNEYVKFENIERRTSLSMILVTDGIDDDSKDNDDNVCVSDTELNNIESF